MKTAAFARARRQSAPTSCPRHRMNEFATCPSGRHRPLTVLAQLHLKYTPENIKSKRPNACLRRHDFPGLMSHPSDTAYRRANRHRTADSRPDAHDTWRVMFPAFAAFEVKLPVCSLATIRQSVSAVAAAPGHQMRLQVCSWQATQK